MYRTTALRYLRETDIALAQVAAAMGYSEHCAFTRACNRWFGHTPSVVQREAITEGNLRNSDGRAPRVEAGKLSN